MKEKKRRMKIIQRCMKELEKIKALMEADMAEQKRNERLEKIWEKNQNRPLTRSVTKGVNSIISKYLDRLSASKCIERKREAKKLQAKSARSVMDPDRSDIRLVGLFGALKIKTDLRNDYNPYILTFSPRSPEGSNICVADDNPLRLKELKKEYRTRFARAKAAQMAARNPSNAPS